MNKFTFDLQVFAQTKTDTMVNPEVMGDMISASLPKAIKFTNIAKVDTRLQGQPGNTVTIPSWNYIGDAETIAEGVAIDPTQMTTSTKEMPIAKAGKAIEITDEAILSGYGDPVGEATRQLTLAIASKVEEDVIKALGTTSFTKDAGAAISYAGIVDAVDLFAEESDTEKYIFVHPKQITALRKDEQFIDKTKYGNDVMATGEIGMIAGVRVVVSRRVPDDGGTKFDNFIVCTTAEPEDGTPVLPAVTIFLKRDVAVKSDYDVLASTNVIAATEHYGVGLTNESKVIKVTFTA